MGHSWSPLSLWWFPQLFFILASPRCARTNPSSVQLGGEARRPRGRIGHVEQNAWKAGFPVDGGAQVLEKEAVGEGNLCCMG